VTSHPRPTLAAQARAETPLGPVRLAATERGLAGLWFEGQAHEPGPLAAPDDRRHPVIAQALDELAAYWRGEQVDFRVPLDPAGTPFQQAVWRSLRGVARGCTTSYGELAAQQGRPRAARATAQAVGRNPIAVIVPCHRVLGRDGALTGYAGGLERKRALLRLEAGGRG
jgi:methylated-DNA-[protein]-cysteine S-methyltransferase